MPPSDISSFVTASRDAGNQKDGFPFFNFSSFVLSVFIFLYAFNVEDREGYNGGEIIRGDLIRDGVGLYGSVGYRGDEYKGCLDGARYGIKELDTNGSLVDLYEGTALDIIGGSVDLYDGDPLDITGTPDEDSAFLYDGSVLITAALDELTGLFDKFTTPESDFSVIMGR